MAYTIQQADIWTGPIADKPGGLGEKLTPLAAAGADFEFVLARRDASGKALAFVAPVQGPAVIRAAKAAGLGKSDAVQGLRIEGPNKAGLGAKVCQALAEAELNMRGLCAAAVSTKVVAYAVFDNKIDAAKAKRILVKALNG